MKFNKLNLITCLFAVGLLSAGTYSASAVTVLTFEGLGQEEEVLNFYNGGTGSQGSSGPNYGISFGSDSIAATSGNFSNNPSGKTILLFLSGPGDVMNVAAGFNTGFSFYYAASVAGTVSVYSGLNGTGSLLASLSLPVTSDPYTVWTPIGVTFSGTADSVIFSGAANFIGFDNITIGSATAGTNTPGAVPDGGSTLVLLGSSIFGIGMLRRRFGAKV